MTMWLDGDCGVYFYDKTQPNMVYSYDRNTGDKYKARILLDKQDIIKCVGKECYEKYHHGYILTDLKPLKHLPREFMNYIRRKSNVVPHKYLYSLGY